MVMMMRGGVWYGFSGVTLCALIAWRRTAATARRTRTRIVTTTDDERIANALISMDIATDASIVETIRSFYWWKDAVANDEEYRVEMVTNISFDATTEYIRRIHNYDVPMILTTTDADDDAEFWKGTIDSGTIELAETLASSRIVACAQYRRDGTIDVKTVSSMKAAVERVVTPERIRWYPVHANSEYLKWMRNAAVGKGRGGL